MYSRFRTPLRIALIAGLALQALPPAAYAQIQPQAEPLAALLAEALEVSPSLLAARARVDAAMRRPVQARSLPDPTLTFTLRNADFPELTIGEEMMSLVGLRFTQAIPTGGKRPAREQLALDGVDVALARVEIIRRRIIVEVAQLYYRIGFVDDSIALIDDTRLLLQELERTAQACYGVGEALQQDILKAQVELSRLLVQRATLAQARDSLVAELNAVLNRPSAAKLGTTERPELPPFPEDFERLQRAAAAASAELEAVDRQLEQQQSGVELARVGDKPDLLLSGGWMYRGSLPSIWEINVGVGLPIRQSQRQEPATDEASDELRALRQDRASRTLQVEAAVRDAWLRMNRARELVEMYDSVILPQAALSLESTMSSYQVARVDFLSVLDAIGKLLMFRTELERETAEYLIATAQLEQHLGRSIGATPLQIWAPAGDAPAQDPMLAAGESR